MCFIYTELYYTTEKGEISLLMFRNAASEKQSLIHTDVAAVCTTALLAASSFTWKLTKRQIPYTRKSETCAADYFPPWFFKLLFIYLQQLNIWSNYCHILPSSHYAMKRHAPCIEQSHLYPFRCKWCLLSYFLLVFICNCTKKHCLVSLSDYVAIDDYLPDWVKSIGVNLSR